MICFTSVLMQSELDVVYKKWSTCRISVFEDLSNQQRPQLKTGIFGFVQSYKSDKVIDKL